jgi:nicotinamide-nucleotide amidase
MKATILSIGTELTTGQQTDTNAGWLASELTRLGSAVECIVAVGDDREPLQAVLRSVLKTADFIIATGGLGPTADDLTRFALADAIDRPVEENAEALAQIQALFSRWQRPWHEANRVQAMIPKGCLVIPNPRGTAPGIHYPGERELYALPGVPAEMKAMFAEYVAPRIAARAGGRRTVVARVQTYGMSEARVGELLDDLMRRDRNPLVGTTASQAIIGIRILSTGATEVEARSLAERDRAEICRRLGHAAFGVGDYTLAESVAELLIAKSRTVSVAESCTGGLVAKRLTDVPGSSACFLRGYVTYSDQSKVELLGVAPDCIKQHGAVSEETARQMAAGCRERAASDYALGVTGVAGPSGGTLEKPVGLVYIGLADESGVLVKHVLIGDHLTRSEIRTRAAHAAINLLRLRLLGVAHI